MVSSSVSNGGGSAQILLLILLPISACFLLPLSLDARETKTSVVADSPPPPEFSFSFDFFDASRYDAIRDLKFEGDASVSGNQVDLTCSSFDQGNNGCTGRMSYNHPVPFYDDTTLASFSTSFTFVIQVDDEADNSQLATGGMAFFVSGYPSIMPPNSGGDQLGLLNPNQDAASGAGQFVAVEFDMFQDYNQTDRSDNQIYIDINCVQSSNSKSFSLPSLSSGTMTATIQFNNITGLLVASLRSDDSTEPIVQLNLMLPDPKSLLPREVAVGFSAATSASTKHQILAWSFYSTLAAPTPHKGHKSTVLAIAIVGPILALFICGIVSFKFIKRHRKGKGSQEKGKMNVKEEGGAIVWALGMSSEFMVYDFLQVLEATNNFSEENKLGQGGFGPVYKGRFHDGLEIAVKRLASHSGQGFREFQNEIELIAKLQHTNLVRLLGCSSRGDERLLIYEYMPNKSLDFYIFDERQRVLLEWNKRLAIIEGIAQGILYLHKHSRLRVIHRDLKASNILLDCEMNPKISDFGLAKIFNLNDAEGNTKRIVGTYGYMAPEYASEGLFSIKSDVFSFGVLTLEIISGKRASSSHQYGEFINLLGHAWQFWIDGLWLQLVDTSLGAECHTIQIMRCINIALLCVQENAVDRPTMSEVVAMLYSDSMAVPEPKHPAYFHVRVGIEEASSVDETSGVNDITISSLRGR
ncbi:unnamed protein product [Urochloa decumbens]|uniref:non-specific serine/threonine protein kinase n=1 Tax=Urochloa decumbens TaxID=240449 RepID=A0ABC9AK69_9POAL